MKNSTTKGWSNTQEVTALVIVLVVVLIIVVGCLHLGGNQARYWTLKRLGVDEEVYEVFIEGKVGAPTKFIHRWEWKGELPEGEVVKDHE